MASRWQETVDLIVELGIGSTRTDEALDVWDTALWSANSTSGPTWSGLEPLWVEIERERIVKANVMGGRDHIWDSFDTGTATVEWADEDNRYAWHPDQDTENLELRPGSPIRISARHNGITYPMFRGFVEIITELLSGKDVITVQADAQDALGQLARVNNLEQPPVGTGELTHQRVERLLDSALWPSEWRVMDTTSVPHQATTLAQPVLDELMVTVWTEGGGIYGDKKGNVRLRNRSWLFEDPHSTTVQRKVGNTGGGICPAEIEWSRAADDVVNEISLARVGGSAYTTRDEGSIGRMGLRQWHRFDLTATDDGPIVSRAEQLLDERSEGRMRIDSVVISGDAANDWPFLLAVDYGWRIEIDYRHPIYGWEINLPVYVERIFHEIRDDGWTLTLGVDDVKPYTQEEARWDASYWNDGLAAWF